MEGRITSVYPLDQGLLGRIRSLIEAEADCCPFLRFVVREERDRIVVQLDFPEEARGLIEAAMHPAPAGASGPVL